MKHIIDLREVDLVNVPAGSYQLWNPSFKHKTLEQVEKQTRDYSDVYKYGLFCRETGTIHLYMNCQHINKTFNNDAGINVCDDCNKPINSN